MSKFEMVNNIINKYMLDIKQTVLIGDCLGDFEAAQKAKISFCFAQYGYEQDKKFLIDHADYVIWKKND